MLGGLTLSLACYSGADPDEGSSAPESQAATDDSPGDAASGDGTTSAEGTAESTETSTRSTEAGESETGDPQLLLADAPFARLTREEYWQTVWVALGADVDVQAIPADGRVGAFTSNATQPMDPVHPFLVASEELARDLVPAVFPACEPERAQECVSESFRGALEALYRRSVSEAELEPFAQIVVEVTEAGASPEEATRAMLSAALLSPDFLFRTSASAAGADPRGRQRADHVSYALWDAPPDAELSTSAMEALPEQAVRLSKSPQAVAVFARFLAQWLHVDTDVRLLDPGFDASPDFLELLAFAGEVLQDDRPIADFMASGAGLVHRDNLEAYGMIEDAPEFEDGQVVRVEWSESSGRFGLLGQELFASTTRHPDPSRRAIFRGALFWDSLVCLPVQAPPPGFVDLNDDVSSRLEDSRCMGCHQRLEPVGGLFAGFDRDVELQPGPATLDLPLELAGTYGDLPALLSAVAASRAFADCFARHWLAFFLERPLEEVDDAWVAELGAQVQGGASFSEVVEHTVAGFMGRSEATMPWCEGE